MKMTKNDTIQIPKEYFDLFQIISSYKVSVSKHGIPTYLLDAIEQSVNDYNESLGEDDKKIFINRHLQETSGRFYEVMDLHAIGQITYFGQNIKLPSGYAVTKIEEEKSEDA